ncbi:MAG: 1-acyl-sn-glycerol-3-phosphate acyltransferase [Candidatus Aminicenantes bacterium]|nr:1-acyl-sn-glycerol-3-phosphate acyltransferase [Candidatus Aminicenantes bacterium]
MRLLRNILAFFVACLLILLLFPLVAIGAGIFGRDAIIYSSARLVIRSSLAILGVRPLVRGLEAVDFSVPPLVVCNHLSNLDGPMLVSVLPVNPRVLIKSEARRIPLIGWVMKLADFVFVDRSSAVRRQEALNEAIEKIRRKRYCFLVFPEGTRSRDGAVRDFKKGSFLIAQRAGVPVLPVKLSGTRRLMPPGRKTCGRGTVEVDFHPLLDLGAASEGELPGVVRNVQRRIYEEKEA